MQVEKYVSVVGDFVALVTSGIECWRKAGELLVDLLDNKGLSLQEIAAQSEYLTMDVLIRFEQIGRNQILPKLLVAGFPAAKHLIKVPISEQSRVMAQGVELLVSNPGDSTPSVLLVAAENLTPGQCKQVFYRGAVRTLESQRAYMESERAEALVSEPIHELYRVRGRNVIFPHACEVSAHQLAQILAEISQ